MLLCDTDVLRVFVLSPPACLSDFFGLFFLCLLFLSDQTSSKSGKITITIRQQQQQQYAENYLGDQIVNLCVRGSGRRTCFHAAI